jgi:ParB family transcriptional regulator, chromosome partitioning protein
MSDKSSSLLDILGSHSSKKKIKPAKVTARHQNVSPSIDAMTSTVSYEGKIGELSEKLASLSEINKMPISQKEVTFTYKLIDPDLIDVSPHNLRSQSLLSRKSVDDIYDLILSNGQQEAGLLRPIEGGRYELIDGSRRLFCVRNIPGRLYLAKIGNVPDEDIDLLSRTANISLPISDYEWGLFYLNRLSDFSSEHQLCIHFANEESVSKDTIRNRIEIARMPSWFVTLYHTPNDIATTRISKLSAVLKDEDMSALVESRAGQLLSEIQEEYEITTSWPKHAVIIDDLLKVCMPNKQAKKGSPPKPVKNKAGEVIFTYQQDGNGHQVYKLSNATMQQQKKLNKFLENLLG